MKSILPRTYRSRLIIYALLLISFLAATLIYSFQYARNRILEESNAYLSNAARIYQLELEEHRAEQLNYVRLLSQETRLQEYLYLALTQGDHKPLQRLLNQTFSWLPAMQRLVIGRDGQIISDENNSLLAHQLSNQPASTSGAAFFQFDKDTLTLIATEPVYYRGQRLGTMVLGRNITQSLSRWHEKIADSDLFVVDNKRVIFSTKSALIGANFSPENNHVSLGTDIYRVFKIKLPNNNHHLPEIWHGATETRLIQTLIHQGQRTLLLLVIGICVILIAGFVVIRGFNKPLNRLLAMTHEVTEGQLPKVECIPTHTELDVLYNNFADMIEALRDKQNEINRVQQELQMSAITDTLTGLYNRRHLIDIFPKLQAQARRDNRIITAIICDLDHFKQLNDRYGHLAGDQALRDFAKILTSQSRGNDFIYRLGGEEFLILSLSSDPHGAATLAEKIRSATCEHLITHKGHIINMTVSCGVSSMLPTDDAEHSLNNLLTRTDRALYQAKQSGRNQVRVYNNVEDLSSFQKRSEDMRSAL
ncbi:MAG: sensor domain-containing diguanylate cyclase [Gammaproteobacteria bacterium]|nr:sensor domain-containing diguanylate cyclase [Gammaproteobacteria bacterium]